ncbi:rod shape-determining protein [Priestia megaterium]|jgi:rod shape-determining protein MreB|uniref:Cell shape-determining protein MreB n=8 Tax=Bacillaceae TaxID=186817 RepID=D5DWF3_PRIM1|nr:MULTISPECIES: rod shape-determining protein [Priestia]AVX10978.1 rod shape-determining protein [Bacillus sp. Y-01]KOP77040.1 rod shape-determining protein MreB [Bacillus sp. FJAT-21351]KQU18161.1 rod shape-determining protein MreB [Bacillus sp. Leaf75]KRD82949.1 rod shape-determining protein MreB [Bacillus sp. Root147]KRD95203.1 rod shape-determining protein MreB [Bacillus sp. Root239]KRF47490.1 rod shape-determining protein MreB [Bacillus sp. Soil531]MBK0294837.1 rod shape-determining pr
MLAKDIGIDLGTANVLIHVKGKGIVLNEPSVVAIDKNTNRVLAVGEEARRMVGRTPSNIIAIRPLKDGVIADFEITESMLKHFINKLNVKGFLSKPRILICCPTNITSVEQKAIREAAEKSGGKTIYLEEEPKVAAIGAGMDIFQPSGNMVVDIGGGTTDVAVLSMGDIVTAASIKMAGDRFDAEILQYIKQKYKLLIGERTAEEIKVKIGTVFPKARNEELDIRGRDMVSGLPRTVTVYSEEVEEALRESVSVIVQASKSVLERTPPELSADIIDRGVILTGGGALLHGMDQLLAEELKVPVLIAENPMGCVAVGTGIMLDNIDKLSRRNIV